MKISKRQRPWMLCLLALPLGLAACSGAAFVGDLDARLDAGAAADARIAPDSTAVPDAEALRDGAAADVREQPDGATACTTPLAAGDLVIDEILIASRRGLGDDGEWVEIRSQRTCTLDIGGVVISSPRGPSVDSITLPLGTTLAPGARFLVASAPAVAAQGLTGIVFTFAAGSTDVFANGGDSVRIARGPTLVHELTYPTIDNDGYGRSLAFPSDCAPTRRLDPGSWALSTRVLTATVKGTPNRVNDDTKCPSSGSGGTGGG